MVPKVKSGDASVAEAKAALETGIRVYSASYWWIAAVRATISVLAILIFATFFTWVIAGNNKPARTAMMAITTRSSIRVKAVWLMVGEWAWLMVGELIVDG